ncbi:MAG: ABC transporter ATP-binding protein [Oscillospiraceae bacterium]|nr:ABC transporter ATP-binding protein [Oscillospiraceae bacterium]
MERTKELNQSMTKTILNVKNLSKSYGQVKAVDDLSFAVPKGSLFAFLGQNGAGKSTTINVLIGLLAKDSGEIVYGDGGSYADFKNRIGTVFQDNILDENLTVAENMRLFGTLYLKDKTEIERRFNENVSLLTMESFLNQRVKTLSGGQRRKAEIARALWCKPEILFLDEPTTGLDPKTRMQVWDVVNNLRKNTGMTVFLTTHYMEETADADEVVIIHKGRKAAQGSPAELKSQYSSDRLLITPNEGTAYTKEVADTGEAIDFLHQNRSNIRFFESKKGTMDDVFLNAVGERLGDDI